MCSVFFKRHFLEKKKENASQNFVVNNELTCRVRIFPEIISCTSCYLQPLSFEEWIFNCHAIINPNTVNIDHSPHA